MCQFLHSDIHFIKWVFWLQPMMTLDNSSKHLSAFPPRHPLGLRVNINNFIPHFGILIFGQRRLKDHPHPYPSRVSNGHKQSPISLRKIDRNIVSLLRGNQQEIFWLKLIPLNFATCLKNTSSLQKLQYYIWPFINVSNLTLS